jgi:hypothetical protein
MVFKKPVFFRGEDEFDQLVKVGRLRAVRAAARRFRPPGGLS